MISLEMVFYKDAAANGMTVWQYCLHFNPLSKLRYFLGAYGRAGISAFCTLLFCRQPANVPRISCDSTDFSFLSLLRWYGADTSACVPRVPFKCAGTDGIMEAG